jgi:flagellar hook-associated protein 1 FlgK
MPSTFLGLEIGATGLAAAQLGQNVTGNNITNANTPGYSVETVDFQANPSLSPPDSVDGTLPNGQVGTGVSVGSITRASDQYLNSQVRASNADVASQTTQNTALQQVEQAYGEPSDSGLNETLTQFYQSFNAVVSNPEDTGAEATVVQDGVAVTNSLQSIQSQLSLTNTNLSSQQSNDLQSISSYATQIAQLNGTIRASQVAGQQPNTLLDQRDQLLNSLSSLANISVQQNSDGTVNVAIGSSDLVVGTQAHTVTVAGLQSRGDLQSGDLAGVVQAQANVQSNITSINNIASALATQVNAIHSTGAGSDGTTGLNFFNVTAGNEAASITVNPTLTADPTKLAIAAVPTSGGAPPPGDTSNAVTLAALQTQSVSALNNTSVLGYYQTVVTTTGSKAATTQTALTSAQASQTQATQQLDSVTGVSTDQEMINLLQYQSAYQASAKVVQTMDSMLNTLITGLFP